MRFFTVRRPPFIGGGHRLCGQKPRCVAAPASDEVERPRTFTTRSLMELNGFDTWNVKLLITCRTERMPAFIPFFGNSARAWGYPMALLPPTEHPLV